jgi:hypothetical protein
MLSVYIRASPDFYTESYTEIENRISEAYNAYFARGKPKILPLAREFNVPYQRLYSIVNDRDSRSTRAITTKY